MTIHRHRVCLGTHSLAIARQALAQLIPQRDSIVPDREFCSGFRCPDDPPGEPAGKPVSIEFFRLVRGLFGIPTPLRLPKQGGGPALQDAVAFAMRQRTSARSWSALPLRRFSGWGDQVPRDCNPSQHCTAKESGAGAPHSKTLSRSPCATHLRQVLECAASAALFGVG